ncbi:MAG: AsmA-like C-terminal region-containing protein [Kiritimatiellia bacterium]
MAHLESAGLVLETSTVKLDLGGGVVADRAALYARGVPGAPLVEARRVRLRFDLPALLRGAPGWLRSVTVDGGVIRTPRNGSDANRRAILSALPPREYRIELRHSEVFGVTVEWLTAHVRARGANIAITRLQGLLGTGRGRGSVNGHATISDDGTLSARLETDFDPHVLDPIARRLSGKDATMLSRFTFMESPPHCVWDFSGAPEGIYRLSMDFQGNRFRYRGEPVAFAAMHGVFEGGPVTNRMRLDPLLFVLGEQTSRGTLSVDWETKEAEFELASDADPGALARLVGWDHTFTAQAVRGGGGGRVVAGGRVAWTNPARNDATLRLDGVSLSISGLLAESCVLDLRLQGVTNRVNELRGRLYGGTFTGSGWIESGHGEDDTARLQMHLEILHADLQGMLRDVTRPPPVGPIQGRVYGTLDMAGLVVSNRVRVVDGDGTLRIKDGQLFRLPLFGRFTESMSRSVPGVNWASRTTDLRVPFTIRDGVVSTEDAFLEGDVVALTARGTYRLANGELDGVVQVKPLRGGGLIAGALRAMAYPASKLFEFQVDGTLGAPVWTLRHWPDGGEEPPPGPAVNEVPPGDDAGKRPLRGRAG